MTRYAAVTALVALVIGLWGLYGFAGDYRVFGGVSTAHVVLWTAWLASAILLIVIIGRLIFGFGFALIDREATGLQRGILYSVLTFVVVSGLLASLGLDIRAVFTTSVVATAILGLAIQPTLGSLIAGSALHLDRVLHVGDIIMRDRERIEVTALGWRSITGRKHGSTVVVIPNSRLFAEEVNILRANRAVRQEVDVPAPISFAPHRISDMLTEAIYDIPFVDPALPVRVAPIAYQPLEGYLTMRARFWIRHGQSLSLSRATFLSRLWYIYQREDVPWPVSSYFTDAIGSVRLPPPGLLNGLRLDQLDVTHMPGLRSAVLGPGLPPELAKGIVADSGPPLCFCDGELLVMPRRVDAYSMFLLVEGELREAPPQAAWHGDLHVGEEAVSMQRGRSDRRMTIERIGAHLARHIGPYAETVVREAAATDMNPRAVIAAAAREIEDPQERQNFMSGIRLDEEETFVPGFVFGLQGDAGYSRMSFPALRAIGGAVIVPLTVSGASGGSPRRDARPAGELGPPQSSS